MNKHIFYTSVAALCVLLAGCAQRADDDAGESEPTPTTPTVIGDDDTSGTDSSGTSTSGYIDAALADVDMTALQATLDQWDSENSQAAYFVVTANTDHSLYTATYGEAATGKSGICTTFADPLKGIGDLIKTKLPVAAGKRTEKYRVLIDTDVWAGQYTGDDLTGDYYTIWLQDHVILDFAGHTFHADTTDDEASGVRTKLLVPFMLKGSGSSDVSIRNVTIEGNCGYAIWVRGSENLVFDNITMTLGENSGLGLRVAMNDTTWSKNVYIDNITVTGAQDQAVETAGVDGLWVGTVTATDCNDCALLLGSTTNALVGTVRGTRCSPRGDSGVYAALRCANYVGPNVHIHEVVADECGRGFFCVSANHGITLDKLTATNCYASVLIQDTQDLLIKSGTITAGSHYSDVAIALANGSSGAPLPVLNNTFQNLTISGYRTGIEDHAEGVSDFINVSGCTISATTPLKLYGANNNIGGKLGGNGERDFSGDSDTTELAIDSTEIAAGAYRGYTALKSVTIPAGVTSIGDGAFYGCTALESVTIAGACTIGADAFYGCTALTSLTISGAVTEIGDRAFGKTALESVELPASVVSFGSNIFDTATESVTVRATAVTKMGSQAFFNLAPQSVIDVAFDYSAYLFKVKDSAAYFTDEQFAASGATDAEKAEAASHKGEWMYWYHPTRSTLQ